MSNDHQISSVTNAASAEVTRTATASMQPTVATTPDATKPTAVLRPNCRVTSFTPSQRLQELAKAALD